MATNRQAISKRTRFEVFKRDSFKCQYCGASAPDVLLEVDHIHPVAKDGGKDITNLITACKPCNAGKSDKLLSDDATVQKRKRQLDSLQDRREQLEMISEWQNGLLQLDQQALTQCAELFRQVSKYSLSDTGKEGLRKTIKSFGAALTMESIRAIDYYLKVDASGIPTKESAELALSKVHAICVVKKREKAEPDTAELYRIRGFARKKLDYFSDWRAMNSLKAARDAGVPMQDMWNAAHNAGTFSKFQRILQELIDVAEAVEVEVPF